MPRSTLLATVSAGLILSLCGVAHAQNALDRNLSTTQGPINQRAPSIQDQIRFNNAVINGTAPGGASFRGYTGYRAPDQFGTVGTRVPSDDLYAFRRDSFMSGVANTGVRGSDALRYQFALTTGQYVPGFMAAAPLSIPKASTTATGGNTTPLRSTSDYLTQQSSRPVLIGVREDNRGAEYVARASPLLGITWVKTAESPLATPAANEPRTRTNPELPGATPPQTPLDQSPTNVPGPGGPGSPSQPGEPNASPAGVPSLDQRVGTGFTGMESAARGVTNVLDHDRAAIDTRVQGPTAVDTEQHAQIVTRIRQSMETPETTPTPKPGAAQPAPPATFEEQMERLQRTLRGEPQTPTAKSTPVPPGTVPPETEQEKKAKEKKKQEDQNNQNAPGRPGAPGNTTPPDTNRPGALGNPNARPSTTDLIQPPTKTPPEQEALTPDVLRAMRSAGDSKLDHLIAANQVAAKGIANPEAYNANMRDGEKLIADGRFFDAEERFVRALASAPGDPMASAGRIHAEIGAGLYLSAAANLRALFTDHPEMVGTRYADKLLPPPDRAAVITDLLTKQEKKAAGALSRETALLVAYMGYQQNDQKLITEGLNDLAARLPTDASGDKDRALVQLLRGVWLAK